MSPSLWISQDYFPATAPPRPSFPDEPKFLDSLPDVSQFLCLMFPDFFAWCFPIFCRMLPDFFTLNVSRLPDVPWFLFLMYPNFLAWCFPISLLYIYQCLCRISVFLFPVDPYISCPCSFYNSNCESEIFTSKLISTQFSLLLFIWNFEQITVPQCWLCCWVTTLCRRRGGLLGKIWSSVTISYERHNVVTGYDNLRKDNVVTAMSSCAELTGQLQPSGRKLLTNNYSLSKYFNRLKSNNFLSHIASLGIHLVHLVCWSRRRPLKTNLKPETLG